MLSPAREGLFGHLGGFDALERGVNRFWLLAEGTPEFSALVLSAGRTDAQWQLQLLLTELLGGPMAYDGPAPAEVWRATGLDARGAERLIDLLVGAMAEGGGEAGPLADFRRVVTEFAASLGVTTWRPVPAAAPVPPPVSAAAALVHAAERVTLTHGVGDWPLFVLDAELVVVHQSPAAMGALPAADADLRRTFGLGALQLMGQSVLRFHSAPTQLHGMLNDTARLPREIIWSFGRTTWRVRLFALPMGAVGRAGFAMAWHDESEAHRRDAVLARLRAQAEELPVPVMFPEAHGDLWYGNAACEHALARLTPWLPLSFDPSNGIPGALFFPDAEEREALFSGPEALPLKKRITFGPETVSLLVSAVCDDAQRMLCPQVTWEIVHRTLPAAPAAPPTEVEPVAAAPAPLPVASVRAATVPQARPHGLREAGDHLRREARAIDASALALSRLGQLLDALADQAGGEAALPAAAPLSQLVEGGHAAARVAEQGLVALAAARGIAGSEIREPAVRAALDQLMVIARRTNRLMMDASLQVVEDALGHSVGTLLERASTVREGVDTGVAGLVTEAQLVERQLAAIVGAAGRLTELRDALDDTASAPPAEVLA